MTRIIQQFIIHGKQSVISFTMHNYKYSQMESSGDVQHLNWGRP